MIKNSSNCQRFKATHIAKQRKPAAPDKACQRECLSPRSDEKKNTIAQQWLYVMRVLVLN